MTKLHNDRVSALVLVSPGSLFGSAEFSLGRGAARDSQALIGYEVESHEGHLIVIDGFLSDEISDDFEEKIERGLVQAQRAGLVASRIWACDSGAEPFDGWKGLSHGGAPVEFPDQMIAAQCVGSWLGSSGARVTGAWATHDDTGGCVNLVRDALNRTLLRSHATICWSALFSEENLPEDNIEELSEDSDQLSFWKPPCVSSRR
ncbi:hypothetical protein [Tranquillimonas alkanivorans]|nr:hypothetical protein [Tranquillimonas alkanivorans]